MKILQITTLLLFFLSCTKDDPCKDTVCLNGGACTSGVCECPPGYAGPSCAMEIAPASMVIAKVRVTKWPQTDNGAGWDIFDGPDISILIKDGTGAVILKSQSYFEDAQAGQIFEFIPAAIVTIPQAPVTIQVWDYDDGLGDDFLGGIIGSVYNAGQKFPKTITFECATCPVSFELDVLYYF